MLKLASIASIVMTGAFTLIGNHHIREDSHISPTIVTHPLFEGTRGVGGGQTFFFPRPHPIDPSRYDADPYTPAWNTTMPAARLIEIKRVGFDFFRLVLDPGPLLEADAQTLEKRLSQIKEAIDSCLKAGLKVLVDVHVSNDHPVWNATLLTAGFSRPEFLRYLQVVHSLAGIVSTFDQKSVALEVFNEPPAPCEWTDRPDWSKQILVIYKEARSAAPTHTLYLSGSCWATFRGLVRMDGSAFDQNTVFVFHYYDPFIFTHQSFWGAQQYLEYVSRLPYPPDVSNMDSAIGAAVTRIRNAPKLSAFERLREAIETNRQLRNYFQNWAPGNIERDFNAIRTWADQYGIQSNRILLGEFGVMKDVYGREGASMPDRIRWLTDVRSMAEKFGYSWSVWSLTGPMGLTVNDNDGPLDPQVLRALGLSSQ